MIQGKKMPVRRYYKRRSTDYKAKPRQEKVYRALVMAAAAALLFVVMKMASIIVAPMMMALFLTIILLIPLHWLQRKGCPKIVALFLVLGVAGILFFGVGVLVVNSLEDFIRQYPQYSRKIVQKFDQLHTYVEHFGFAIGKPESKEDSKTESVEEKDKNNVDTHTVLPQNIKTKNVPQENNADSTDKNRGDSSVAPRSKSDQSVFGIKESQSNQVVKTLSQSDESSKSNKSDQSDKSDNSEKSGKSGKPDQNESDQRNPMDEKPDVSQNDLDKDTSDFPDSELDTAKEEPLMNGLETVESSLSDNAAGNSLEEIVSPLPHYRNSSKQQQAPIELSVENVLKWVGTAVYELRHVAESGFLVLIITIFMIFEATRFPEKVDWALGKTGPINYEHLHHIADEIRRYLFIKSVACVMSSSAATIVYFCFGVPGALLWGVVAFFLYFIPNIGGIVAAIVPGLLIFMAMDIQGVLLYAVCLVGIECTIGYGIEPKMLGHGLGISTVVIFLSLLFWGWILGPVGLFLAAPLTIMVKIILQAFKETEWIAILLGDKTQPNT